MFKGGNPIIRFLLYFFFALIIIGALCKIQHYSYSIYIMLLGVAGVFVVYPIRFAQKKPKELYDYLALLCIEATHGGAAFFMMQ